MADCVNAEIRDRLPDLLTWRLEPEERARLERHVASCTDCAAELALLRSARAMLTRVPAIDTAAVARGVVRRSRARREQGPRWLVPATSRMMRIAAAAVMLVVGGTSVVVLEESHGGAPPVVTGPATPAPVSSVPIMTMTPGGATTPVAAPAGHTQVADAGAARATGGLSLSGSLSELTDAQLQSLLNDIANISSVPAAEPEALLPSLPVPQGGGA